MCRKNSKSSERQIIDFQYKYLLRKPSKTIKINRSNTRLKFLIVGFGESYYLDNLAPIFRDYLGENSLIDFILDNQDKVNFKNLDFFNNIYILDGISLNENGNKIKDIKYDQMIVLTDKSWTPLQRKNYKLITTLVKHRDKIVLDPNMDFSRETNKNDLKSAIKKFNKKRNFYYRNPKSLYDDIMAWVKK